MSEDSGGRRGFLKVIVGLAGAAVGVLVLVPGLGAVLDPLLRRRGGSGDFIPVGEATVLNAERPVSLPVIGEKVDAWTRAPQVQLGTVWLQKGEGDEIIAMTAECPHLGCNISYEAENDHFVCPCHDSSFGLDGSVKEGPSPRPMDRIVARTNDEGLIEVEFKRFRTQNEDKVEIG